MRGDLRGSTRWKIHHRQRLMCESGLSLGMEGFLQHLDAARQVWREVTVVAHPEFRQLPVFARDVAAAVLCAAVTVEFVIGTAVAHGIVEAELFARLNIAHGAQADLPRKPKVGVTGMIEA